VEAKEGIVIRNSIIQGFGHRIDLRTSHEVLDDAELVMNEVLSQYKELIAQRRQKVLEDAPDTEPDLRTGWLIWKSGLREFLYFEEEMLLPSPEDYWAEWKASGGGIRKPSRNLWIYGKCLGRKRYSITTAAGAKIQPYFDVPTKDDPNVYFFQVQREEVAPGQVRVWVSPRTEAELRRIIGDPIPERLTAAISEVANPEQQESPFGMNGVENAIPLLLPLESYRFFLLPSMALTMTK
jgi:hypothetical protein